VEKEVGWDSTDEGSIKETPAVGGGEECRKGRPCPFSRKKEEDDQWGSAFKRDRRRGNLKQLSCHCSQGGYTEILEAGERQARTLGRKGITAPQKKGEAKCGSVTTLGKIVERGGNIKENLP